MNQIEELGRQLAEANDTIEAIRTGQVDALVVQTGADHQVYTLQSADHVYRMFVERMNEGAVTLNRNGIIQYANAQTAQLLGVPLSRVIGFALGDFVALTAKPVYDALVQRGWNGEEKGEVTLLSENGPVSVQLSIRQLQLGETPSLSVIITDLSTQKTVQHQLRDSNLQLARLNERLEASNYDLQQFASVASHDLQEPLRKILLLAYRMLEAPQFATPKKDEEFLQKIVKASLRMRALISNVLSYSRLSMTEGPFVPTDLQELVKEVLEDFELMITEKNAVIHVSDLPVVDAHTDQLRQVFQNLVSNALKFVRAGIAPVISITGKELAKKDFESPDQKGGPFVLIQITDNGIGFDEQYIPRIFSLFHRLHSKDKFEGSGIGLSIAKKIVEKHGGLIRANSIVDNGSTFEVILPRRQ